MRIEETLFILVSREMSESAAHISGSKRYSPDFTGVPAEQIFYALTMFPYPSGVGLHCGHASVFTINDVVARYKRMQGYTVFNPFGFDAFGLPTENYAMEKGRPAYEVTEENEAKFIEQVQALNLSFDYERIVDTSKPDYYKRTQWIFQQLYKAGLVYRAELRVNRCPSCQTVLANDQVVDAKCERCKTEIIQKKMPQRFIKITAYADRLIQDLDTIDRPEETKIAQRNWIGRSEGAEIDFAVEGEGAPVIKVFTTRPDTIYGVTAVVLAPENTLIDSLLEGDKKEELDRYRQTTFAKTPVQRQQELKEKTGVFSGVYAVHPLTGERIPVWFADYVLADYGSGAVMMVPAHDERDYNFRFNQGELKYNFPLINVIKPSSIEDVEGKYFPVYAHLTNEGENIVEVQKRFLPKAYELILNGEYGYSGNGILVNSGEFDGLSNIQAKEKITEHLAALGKGGKKVTYKLRDRSVSRQRYRGSPIPVYYDEQGTTHLIPENELPVLLPLDVQNYKPKGKSPLEEHPTFSIYEKDGVTYRRECDTLDTFMCSSFYFLRYPDAHNTDELIRKELAEKLFPINFYSGGKEHTVGHLLYSRFIHKFLYDQGYVPSPEPFTKLVHQGMVLGHDGRKMGKRYNNGVDPMEMIEKYGTDALRTYLMFMGPVEADKPWNDSALQGVKKFLERIERLLEIEWRGTQSEEVDSVVHQTIRDLTKDLEELKLNTAVSKLMILTNTIYEHQAVTEEQLSYLALLIAPFATELAEKLWTALGHNDDVHYAKWPVENPEKILQGMISLPVQINGKMRGNIEVHPGIDEANVLKLVHQDERFTKYLEGQSIKKIIFVQDKILNLVVA